MASIVANVPAARDVGSFATRPSKRSFRKDKGLSRDSTMDGASREPTNASLRTRRKQAITKLSRNATELSLTSTQGQGHSRGDRRKSSLLFKNLDEFEDKLKKTMPPGWNIREGFQGLVHFRKIVRFIIVFTKWIMAMREEAEKTGGAGSEAISGLANQNFQQAFKAGEGVEFDVKEFASKKEILLSQEVRDILNQHPTLRTADQVQLAKYGLQYVQSFSEYPLHMQEKIATVAYYQEIESKRVIIRQGHVAENFYFILSGSAIVTKIIKKDEDTSETVFEKSLDKGDSFGELELLHHSDRQNTVVSQTPMTLLVVGRDNFFKIFMESQVENELPEHIRFFGSLDVMKGFPIEKLAENPEKCLLHFYRRGALMVRDSQESEWLYVLKSGTCQVLKNLKISSEPTKINQAASVKGSVPRDYSLCLPRLGIGAQSSRTDSGLNRSILPSTLMPLPRRRQTAKKTGGSSTLDEDFLSKQDDALPLLLMEKSLAENDDLRRQHENMLESLAISLEPTTPHRIAAKNNKTNVGYTRSRFSKFPAVAGRPLHDTSTPPHYAPDRIRKNKVHFSPAEEERIISPDIDIGAEERPRLNSLITEKHVEKKPVLKLEVEHPIYVQVDLLKPRDVFGLANIRFDEFLENKSLSVSLVSRGAECIMVEKNFFVEHAPSGVKHAVMSQVRPYPEVETLQGNLQLKATWESYCGSVLRMSSDNVNRKKIELRKTFSI